MAQQGGLLFDREDLKNIIADYSTTDHEDENFNEIYNRYGPNNIDEFINSNVLTSDNFLIFLVESNVEESEVYKYSIGSQEEDDKGNVKYKKGSREIIINPEFMNNKYQKAKLGFSMLLNFMNQPIGTFEYTNSADIQGSDVQDNEYNYDVYGNIEKLGKIQPEEGLGFFIKKLYKYENALFKDTFNFNDDDDNLFCPFTALYKQDKNNILPISPKSREDYYEIYRRCGFDIADSFHLSKDKMFTLYDNFCREYKLNIQLKVYYFKAYKEDIKYERKKLCDYSTLTYKYRYNYNTTELHKFNIARVRGHIFNILGGKETTKLKYLNYLNMNNCMYHSLPLKDNNIKKLSREYAREYNEYVRKRSSDNSQLLLNASERLDSLYELPEKKEEQEKEEKYIFIYDLETVNDENDKFWIYSYYIKCISHPIKDQFFITYKSDTVRVVNIGNETVRIIESPFTKMMEYLITYVPDQAKVILLAHNGSNFDNIIVRELMMSSFGFYDIKEICAGQNQGILLSIDCKFSYYKNTKKSRNYNPVPEEAFKDGQIKKTISLSLRDSKKIINFAVKDLPDAFGVNAYKLPYDYEFYQKFIIEHDHKRITDYRLKTYFNKQLLQNEKQLEHIRNDMKNHFNQEFIDEYMKIITYEYTNNLPDGRFKEDILRYIDQLIKDGKYYDIQNYCALYNRYDVLVVAEALNKFQLYINSLSSYEKMCEMIKLEIKDEEKQNTLIDKLPKDKYIKGADKINIYDFRSLASIVFKLCENYGVYDDIYLLKGDLKLFVQASVVGGRVMANGKSNHKRINNYDELLEYVGKEVNDEYNEKIKELLRDGLLDFDAVSLYPSAIFITHMPSGKPSIFNFDDNFNPENTIEKLKNTKKKFFICCDLVTQKDLKYPLLSELNQETQTRNFRNGQFNKIVIGDQTFRDLVQYQDVKILKLYTLVIFPTTSDTFSKLIETLFNLRLLLKAMGLKCQETVKCLMNCSYGRTILKQSHYKTKYFKFATTDDKKKFTNFLSKNFHLIKPEINCYGTIYKKVSKKDSSTPQGYPHVGSAILETSKSLMHKAFNLLDDNVYYTDTDSMHIEANDLSKVNSIIGKNMCQFHSDFDPSTKYNSYRAVDPKVGIVAIESIFVMKKCYYDELFCIDNKTNKYCIREHKRVKGLPARFMDKEKYKQLINGEELTCDLSKYCNMLTKKNKTGELVKINRFTRTIRQVR